MMTSKSVRYRALSLAFFLTVFTIACGQQESAEAIEEDPFRAEGFEIPEREAPEEVVKSVEGELVQVDPDGETFVVRTAAGEEIEFKYGRWTVIRGAEEGVEGLLTETGAHVKVEYESDWFTHTATTVEIHSEGSAQ